MSAVSYRSSRRVGALARLAVRRASRVGPRRARAHARSSTPGGSIRIETVAADEGRVPTIVDLAPAAGWDEREAADLYGIRFDGHEPLRPLVDHDLDLRHWTVRVRGDDAYQIAVGPIHAGVIESGHFRFHVVGDRILHLDARLFYKHRGLERAAEGSSLEDGLAYAMRACAACAVSNSVAYAHACEDALGLRPTRRAGARPHDPARARARLEPPQRHRRDLRRRRSRCREHTLHRARRAGAAAERPPDPAPLPVRLRPPRRERARHRQRDRHAARDVLAAIARRDEKRAGASCSSTHLSRTDFPTSEPSRSEDARTLGAVGPAARASGLADDVRTSSARLAYDGFTAVMPDKPTGDVQARLEQRALELWLVRSASRAARPAPRSRLRRTGQRENDARRRPRRKPARRDTLHRRARRGPVERLRLRTGSYANWPVVAHAAAGNLLPDFPLINKSFELCYACTDR